MLTAPLNGPRLAGDASLARIWRGLEWLVALALCLWLLQDARAAVAVKAARLGSTVDSQRIVIEFEGPVTYKYFTLADPSRLVLDLAGVDPGSDALKRLGSSIKADDPYLAGMRLAVNRPGVARLVTDLKTVMQPQVSLLKASGDFGPRLVIDLIPGVPGLSGATVALDAKTAPKSNPQSAAGAAVPPPVVAKGSAVETTIVPVSPVGVTVEAAPAKPVKTAATLDKSKPAAKPAIADKPPKLTKAQADPGPSLEKQVEQAIQISGKNPDADKNPRAASNPGNSYKRLITVAIDAGHGGVDPGALGANGSQEKDITLAVAKRLKAHIEMQEGMRAVLTRDGDYFIALHERVNKARRNQADLFVSIHADAFLKTTARGSSVFALSEKGASSAAARWLAKRENDADMVGGINIDVKDVYLKQTLIDLSQTATIADSLKLGKAVLDELGEINDLHKAHVEQAGFAVLKAPDIPSILVETAFISNPEEEERLLDEDYQDKMAAAIVTGIKAYFDNNPPMARSKVAQNL